MALMTLINGIMLIGYVFYSKHLEENLKKATEQIKIYEDLQQEYKEMLKEAGYRI
jgi:hypothetical protein